MFVVFEGIDGSGKTTISNQVAERLRSRGLTITHLRAEGKFASAVSEAIRDLGRDSRNLDLVPQAEFLLYVARDVQLIEEVMRPALGSSDVVLADRFLFTAEALGRYGRHLPDSWTGPVLRSAAGGIVPDLVVLVDVDPTLARARRKVAKLLANDKRPPSRKGLAGVGLQHRLRKGYLELAAASPERWVVVDNEGSLEQNVEDVAALIEQAQRASVTDAMSAFRSRRAQVAASAFSTEPLSTPADGFAAFLRWLDLRVEREPRAAAYLLGGLHGAGVDERRRALAPRVPEVVLGGLAGLADDVSWELREAYRETHPRHVARTLTGLGNHPRAVAMRTALEAVAPAEIAMSLASLDDDATWALRERLYGVVPEVVVGALGGLDCERSWALRKRYLDTGVEPSKSYDAARVLSRSVTSVAGERAWELRRKARHAAPVAALASVTGLTDEESFRWRTEMLRSATKVVMASVRKLDDPRAFELRRAVVADCKEAIDSIDGLDASEAWELRESYLDTWPSTVVKALGPLADAPRGKAIVERALSRHPRNISLLKHVSGIALGNHRDALLLDD
jgi:dTMP kinase